MAEINIQRKSSNAIWWIIGIIALAILLWFLFTWGTTEPGLVDEGVRMIPSLGEPVAAAQALAAGLFA